MKRVFSGVSGHVISIVLRSGPRSIQNSVSQQGGWALCGYRIDQRVGVALEKPVPDPPTTLLTRGLADGLEQNILAQQTPLLSKAISLVVIQPDMSQARFFYLFVDTFI